MNVGDVATPELLVCALAVVPPPAKVPPAPAPGALKKTLAPETRLPYASFTVTTSGLPNAKPTGVLWPLPEVTVMALAGPGVFVNANEAEAPPTDPVTE
jgi:hypothetical protein